MTDKGGIQPGSGTAAATPHLAVVIPAYNEEALIGQCLQAVLDEIARAGCVADVLVVNNASTDQTGAIAARYPGVRVVLEANKGLVHARHRGLVETQAELVANIDADTRMPPGWITTVLTEFAGDPALVALSGPFIYYDLPRWKQAVVRCFYLAAYPLYRIIHDVLRNGSMIQGGNFVFRRTAWEAVGGYDTSISFYGEDTDIARRLRTQGRVKWTFSLPMHTSGRRLANEGMITTGVRYVMNYLWVIFRGRPLTRDYTDVRPTS